MTEFASAAAGVSQVDWMARWIAIASVALSLVSIAVTVTLWQRDGWKLHVKLWHHGPDWDRYIAEVTNVGRMTCTVTVVEVIGLGRAKGWQRRPVFASHDSRLPCNLAPSEVIKVDFYVPAERIHRARAVFIRAYATAGRRRRYSRRLMYGNPPVSLILPLRLTGRRLARRRRRSST